MKAGTLDERPNVSNRISSFDANLMATREIDRSDETIESFDLLWPDACFQPTDVVIVEQIDRPGIESARPHNIGYMVEPGRVAAGVALQREGSVASDEVPRLDVVVDVRKQQGQSSTAADVDTSDVSGVRLDHCEWKQEPITAPDFVGLCRSGRQQFTQIIWVLEDEAYECIGRLVLRGPIVPGSPEIWKVLAELLIGIVQDQEVDTREEENRNPLCRICESHQIENPRFPGHPFGEPAVERCCVLKGA